MTILFLFDCACVCAGASLIAQLVKNPPAMQEIPVLFLGQEDPLEKGWATHSSILVCAKSLQLYLTLCNLRDRSPPGSSVHGIFQASKLG